MIITILEGHVTADKWNELEIAFREGIKHTPPQLKETYLIQGTDTPETWRIITFWRSDQAYHESKTAGSISTCESMFRKIDVKPTRREFKVILRHEHI
jgi:hypothetical protein